MKLYRKILPLLIIVSIVLFAGKTAFGDEQLVITHGPYLVDPGEHSITVVWYTNKRCVSKVEYATGENFRTFPQWGSIVQTTSSSHHGLIDAYTTIHKILLAGLEPGKTYKYRVVSKEIVQFKPYEVIYGSTIVSDMYRFKTLDTKKTGFSFGIVNDGHERSGKFHGMILI